MSTEHAGSEPPIEDGRFLAALDECRRRLAGGEPLDHLLVTYPSVWREELARIAPVAARLDGLRADPDPAFTTGLERRLLAEAESERRWAAARGGRGWRSRLAGRLSTAGIAAVIVLLVLSFGGGAGLSSASASSLPNSPLYGLKRAGEWAQLSLARTPEQRAEVQSGQLAERSRELVQVARTPNEGVGAQQIANRIDAAAGRMVDNALEARAAGNQRPAARAYVTLRLMERRVANALRQALPSARPAILSLEKRLRAHEQRLRDAGVEPPDSGPEPEGF